MINLSTLVYYYSINSGFMLEEKPVKEIRFVNLTDWGWMLFLGILILIVWLLIVLQAKSRSTHEFGQEGISTSFEHGDHQE